MDENAAIMSIYGGPEPNVTQWPPDDSDEIPASAYVIMAAQTMTLAVIEILSLVGNAIVVYIIVNHSQLWTATNAIIASLSTSDLLRTLLCTTFAFPVIITKRWSLGNGLCLANGALNLFFGIASTLMVMLIAVDRLCVLVRATDVNRMKRYVFALVATCWLFSLLFSVPWHAMSGPQPKSYYRDGHYHCMYVFSAHDSYEGVAYSVVVVVVCFLAPCIVMATCCVVMWRTFRRNLIQVRPVALSTRLLRFQGEIHTATTVLVMISVYVSCWTPYCVMTLLSVVVGMPISPTMDNVAAWLAWADAAVNPIIYAVRNPNMSELMNLPRCSANLYDDRTSGRDAAARTPPDDAADDRGRSSALSWVNVTADYIFVMAANRKGSDLSTTTIATTI
ncbi:PREDICTED: probable G-protein coupled receptor 135 [Priapulus caudatus]|uniref:Probable G-protein coupled receptor 135 n=1 Tax=Priapulus caudatus TaxID=37621 RepID=A0ABM1EN07_PRICU|nr:PREDICTED: probable G-protein coupled receptor 135 [Priapulus caudatus]